VQCLWVVSNQGPSLEAHFGPDKADFITAHPRSKSISLGPLPIWHKLPLIEDSSRPKDKFLLKVLPIFFESEATRGTLKNRNAFSSQDNDITFKRGTYIANARNFLIPRSQSKESILLRWNDILSMMGYFRLLCCGIVVQ